MDRCFLGKEQIRAVQRKISIHFIGRYLMITLNAIFTACIHKYRRTKDIRAKKYFRILDRTVNVAFRCKIHNDIRMLFLKQLINGITIGNIFFYKTEIRIIHNRC